VVVAVDPIGLRRPAARRVGRPGDRHGAILLFQLGRTVASGDHVALRGEGRVELAGQHAVFGVFERPDPVPRTAADLRLGQRRLDGLGLGPTKLVRPPTERLQQRVRFLSARKCRRPEQDNRSDPPNERPKERPGNRTGKKP
jgi:hypothetical protein